MARPEALERLASSGPQQIAYARGHLTDLVLAARALATYTAHHSPDPPAGSCQDARCALHAVEAGPQMCSLAHRLATLEVDVPPHAGRFAAPDRDQLVSRFRDAVIASLDAVRMCRQTVHASHRCWFTPLPHHDGCAKVLRLAHHL